MGDTTTSEGASAVFTLTLSPPSSEQVTVRVNTTGGTATADVDYNNINSFVDVVFAPNTTTQTVSVPTFQDAAIEPDETFNFNVLSATGANVADGLGVGLRLSTTTLPGPPFRWATRPPPRAAQRLSP